MKNESFEFIFWSWFGAVLKQPMTNSFILVSSGASGKTIPTIPAVPPFKANANTKYVSCYLFSIMGGTVQFPVH